MLEHYGLPLSKADAIAVFHAFDVNSTGKILYDTFMKVSARAIDRLGGPHVEKERVSLNYHRGMRAYAM